jgi:hypothetical protein
MPGIEGGGGGHQNNELNSLKFPYLVFGGSEKKAVNSAKAQHKELARLLRIVPEHPQSISLENGTEIITQIESGQNVPTMFIFWPRNSNSRLLHRENYWALILKPETLAKGAEGGTLSYKGAYGTVSKNREGKFINAQMEPLEKVFGLPDSAELEIHPTADQWAIGETVLSAMADSEQKSYDFYMGLGFLLLDRRWMAVGLHEIAHTKERKKRRVVRDEENEAWLQALEFYKQSNGSKREKESIFGLLQKPTDQDRLTIGRIIRYGLSTYAIHGNARVPESWLYPEEAGETMGAVVEEFQGHITQARQMYKAFVNGLQ